MSIVTNIDNLNHEVRHQISSELQIKLENKFGMGQARWIFPFNVVGDNIILPFAYAMNLSIPRPLRTYFPVIGRRMATAAAPPPIHLDFEGTLRSEQKIIRKEALKRLSKKGSVMISAFPGFGKTILAINLSIATAFKTLIIVNRILLMKQWEESILKCCPQALVQRLTSKSKKKDCDFYIMNAQNVEKMGYQYFADIGLVIVDEAHLIMAETLSKSMQYVYPRYLIGLTATPYRPDGLDILLEFYFGKYKIIRNLMRKHIAYKIETKFKPKIEQTKTGRINWSVVLDSQARDVKRNELILRVIIQHLDRNFLVLVKRVSQGEYLTERLQELGEHVTNLLGSKQEFDCTARILIGTCQKVGVGFDHVKLDTLLLAADVEEYFYQYLGRIFRTKEVEPIIFDLVDNNSILRKHFNTRRATYQKHGGIVKIFDLDMLPALRAAEPPLRGGSGTSDII